MDNFEKIINFAVHYDMWLHSDMITTINSLKKLFEGNL